MIQNLLAIIYGCVFGVANIIPGVSGGTMLVVFGCYDKVCGALSLNFKEIKKNIVFLIFFAIGAVIGILGFSFVITWLFDNFPTQTYLFFMGLILGSIPLIVKNATIKEKFNVKCIIPFLLALALVVGLTFLEGRTGSQIGWNIAENNGTYSAEFTNTSGDTIKEWSIEIESGAENITSVEGIQFVNTKGTVDKIKDILGMETDNSPNTFVPAEENMKLEPNQSVTFTFTGTDVILEEPEYSFSVTVGLFIKLLLAAIIAAIAMIIPGVSGSFIMVLLGVYATIIAAIKGLEIFILIPVAIGAVFGLVFGARLITMLLKKHRLIVFSAILGLVVGSIFAIFPEGIGFNIATLTGVIAFIAGGAVSILVGKNTKPEE